MYAAVSVVALVQIFTPPAVVTDTCADPGSSSIPYNWTVGVEGETVRTELASCHHGLSHWCMAVFCTA